MLGIDEEFNMDDIEKDDDLQNELRLLGWRDEESPARGQSREKKRSQKPKRDSELRTSVTSIDAQEIPNYSIDNTEFDADADVEFTDEDMKDPYLLSQLRTLSAKDYDANLVPDKEDEDSSGDDSDSDSKPDATRGVQSASYPTRKSVDTFVATPTSPNKPIKTSTLGESTDVVTADMARSRAIAFHKDGNKQEALKWLKISKSMESDTANISAKSRSKETVPLLPLISKSGESPRVVNKIASGGEKKVVYSAPLNTSTQNERFSYLESALNTAIKETLREAQLLLNIDRPASAKKLQSHKRYKAELGVLASRKCLEGAEPAPFTWKTIEKQTVIEHLDVGDDQLFLDIESILDLEASLVGHSSRSVVLSYDLGFPRDAPITGKINGKVDGKGNVILNFHSVLPIIKRGRSLQNFLKKTKATFEVSLIRGMFSSNIVLGTASLLLIDLNTKCKCGGVLPIEKSLGATSGKKAGQCSAGSVTAYLKVRKPIQEAEIIRTSERTLVLEAWPSVSHVYKSPPLKSALPEPLGAQPRNGTPSDTKDQQPTMKKKNPDTNSKSTTDYSMLSEREKVDPCSADFLESNDVLEAEIASENAAILVVESKMAKCASDEDESAMFTMKLRLQLMTSKLNALVTSVQQEELSFADYIDKVKCRLERDRVLVQWVTEASRRADPPEDSAQHMTSLIRRISIMERELSEANDAS